MNTSFSPAGLSFSTTSDFVVRSVGVQQAHRNSSFASLPRSPVVLPFATTWGCRPTSPSSTPWSTQKGTRPAASLRSLTRWRASWGLTRTFQLETCTVSSGHTQLCLRWCVCVCACTCVCVCVCVRVRLCACVCTCTLAHRVALARRFAAYIVVLKLVSTELAGFWSAHAVTDSTAGKEGSKREDAGQLVVTCPHDASHVHTPPSLVLLHFFFNPQHSGVWHGGAAPSCSVGGEWSLGLVWKHLLP